MKSSREAGSAATPTKRSVALAIRSPDERLLLVKRPPDDTELPGVWGLPAATLAPGETWTEAARRAAREKLGIDVDLGRELNRGSQQRTAYTLSMRLYEAVIVGGAPLVPQPTSGVTQYADWRWGAAEELRPAAARGSLCCQLMLRAAS